MKRIRYDHLNDGAYESKNTFDIHGVEYKIYLSYPSASFEIVEVANGLVAFEGNAGDASGLKRKAKKAIQQLGYVFDTEVRTKTQTSTAA